MPAKGSPKWHRDRREGYPEPTPAAPAKPLDQMVAEALERLKRLVKEKKPE